MHLRRGSMPWVHELGELLFLAAGCWLAGHFFVFGMLDMHVFLCL